MNQDKDTAWINSYYALAEAFLKFFIENAEHLWHWNGKGKDPRSDMFEWFESNCKVEALKDFSFLSSLAGGAPSGGSEAPAQAAPARKGTGNAD